MSRSFKRVPRRKRSAEYRKPRGRRAALAVGARLGSIPPDPWEDIPVGAHADIPVRAALRMWRVKTDPQDIVLRLMRKFKLDYKQAHAIVMRAGHRYELEQDRVAYNRRKRQKERHENA